MKVKLDLPYPQSLLVEIFGERFWTIYGNGVSQDQIQGLEKTFRTLTPREEKIIKLRYVDELTLEEIATTFDLRKERVRQIIQKTIRKLRHPSRSITIEFGANGENVYREELKKAKNDIKLKQYAEAECFKEMPIDVLNLSNRARNSLLFKLGVSTIAELLVLDDDEILCCRGIGNGTFCEIKQKLCSFLKTTRKEIKPYAHTSEHRKNEGTPKSN